MTYNFKTFNQSDIDEFSKIILVENVDKNALRVLHLHAFFDVRFDVILRTLNENGHDYLLAFAQLYPNANSVYFEKGVGFKFPLNSLSFSAKLDQLRELTVFGKETVKALGELNKLRNRLAHDFKQQVTKRNVDVLSKALVSNPKLQELFGKQISDENLDQRLCGCLLWIFLDVMMNFEKIEIWKGILFEDM